MGLSYCKVCGNPIREDNVDKEQLAGLDEYFIFDEENEEFQKILDKEQEEINDEYLPVFKAALKAGNVAYEALKEEIDNPKPDIETEINSCIESNKQGFDELITEFRAAKKTKKKENDKEDIEETIDIVYDDDTEETAKIVYDVDVEEIEKEPSQQGIEKSIETSEGKKKKRTGCIAVIIIVAVVLVVAAVSAFVAIKYFPDNVYVKSLIDFFEKVEKIIYEKI